MRTWLVALFASSLAACAPPEVTVLADGLVWSVRHDPAQVNAFVIALGGGALALVDTGLDEDAGTLRAALSHEGFSLNDVVAVLFTHGHADHTAGTLRFERARTFARAEEVEVIAGRSKPERPLPGFSGPEETGIEIDETLEDGEVRTFVGTDIEMFALPGHTEGSAAFLAHGVLMLGDAASATDDGTVEGAPWLFSTDAEASDDALSALARRLAPRADEIEALGFGHSAPLEDGLAPLEEFAAR